MSILKNGVRKMVVSTLKSQIIIISIYMIMICIMDSLSHTIYCGRRQEYFLVI
jgi:hypothetical protein